MRAFVASEFINQINASFLYCIVSSLPVLIFELWLYLFACRFCVPLYSVVLCDSLYALHCGTSFVNDCDKTLLLVYIITKDMDW